MISRDRVNSRWEIGNREAQCTAIGVRVACARVVNPHAVAGQPITNIRVLAGGVAIFVEPIGHERRARIAGCRKSLRQGAGNDAADVGRNGQSRIGIPDNYKVGKHMGRYARRSTDIIPTNQSGGGVVSPRSLALVYVHAQQLGARERRKKQNYHGQNSKQSTTLHNKRE